MIVIAGLPGSGWETVAQLLAHHWGVDHTNTDTAICQHTQAETVAEAYLQLGETAFRDLERDVLQETLATEVAITCVGSGVIENPESARLLTATTGVFCDVDVPTALKRLRLRTSVTAGINPRATWVRLAAARRDAYTTWATHTVNTSYDSQPIQATPAPTGSGNTPAGGPHHTVPQPDTDTDQAITKAVHDITQHITAAP